MNLPPLHLGSSPTSFDWIPKNLRNDAVQNATHLPLCTQHSSALPASQIGMAPAAQVPSVLLRIEQKAPKAQCCAPTPATLLLFLPLPRSVRLAACATPRGYRFVPLAASCAFDSCPCWLTATHLCICTLSFSSSNSAGNLSFKSTSHFHDHWEFDQLSAVSLSFLPRLVPLQMVISQSSSYRVLDESRPAKGIEKNFFSGKHNYCLMLRYLQYILILRWGNLLKKNKTLQEGVSCRHERCLWDQEWEKATNYIQNLQQLSCIPFPKRLTVCFLIY